MTIKELIQRAVFDHIIVQGRENDLENLLQKVFRSNFTDNTAPVQPEEGENHAA